MKTLRHTGLLFFIVLMISPLQLLGDDRVQYLGHFDPVHFFELLDVEVRGDTAYLSAVSGFTILEVSDPSSPQLIGRLEPGPGPFARFYQSAVGNGYAYGASRFEGIIIVDMTDPTAPAYGGLYNEEGVAFEGVALVDTLLYAAALDNGIQIFSVADPETLMSVGSFAGLTATKRLAVEPPWLYAADGAGGLKVVDVSDPTAPAMAGSLATGSPAQDVAVSGTLACLATGSGGMEVVDISSPSAPVMLSTFDTPGFAAGVAVQDSLAFVADWDAGIRVVRISDPQNPSLAGWEDTPSRAMGIYAEGIDAFVADWFTFRIYRYGPTDDPDIHLPFADINLGTVEVGESADTVTSVVNTGGALLTVADITSTNTDFGIQPVSFSVTPSDTQELVVTFDRSFESSTNTTFVISSDDPDEENRNLTVEITDSNLLQEGELAPDFTLFDMDGFPHSLSDFRGQVVLLAFFASW